MRQVPDYLKPLMFALAALAVPGMVGSAAQQLAVVSGRVEIGVPIASRRPSAAYPTRAVPAPALAPESERRHGVVYLRDAPPQAVPPM